MRRQTIKRCYGTTEYSLNSAICGTCSWKEGCGKIKKRIKKPQLLVNEILNNHFKKLKRQKQEL